MELGMNCLNQTFLEKLLGDDTLVNFSHMDYIGHASEEESIYGLAIKIALCLLSIIVSLSGNLYVIYSILIKPHLKNRMHKDSNNTNHSCRNEYVFSYHDSSNITRNNVGNITNLTNMTQQINILMHQRSSETILANSVKIFRSAGDFHLAIESDYKKSDAGLCVLTESSENNLLVTKVEKKIIITRIYMPYKKTTANLFILNLCVCDLMIVIWCSWVHLINTISHNWIMGAFFCKFNTYIQGLFLFFNFLSTI
jgi:hypothetical protein